MDISVTEQLSDTQQQQITTQPGQCADDSHHQQQQTLEPTPGPAVGASSCMGWRRACAAPHQPFGRSWGYRTVGSLLSLCVCLCCVLPALLLLCVVCSVTSTATPTMSLSILPRTAATPGIHWQSWSQTTVRGWGRGATGSDPAAAQHQLASCILIDNKHVPN